MGAETPSSSAEQTAADRSEVQMKGIPMTVGDLHRCVRVQLASATDGSDGTPSQFHEDVLEPYIGFLQFFHLPVIPEGGRIHQPYAKNGDAHANASPDGQFFAQQQPA